MKGKKFSKVATLLLVLMIVTGGLFAATASVTISGTVVPASTVSFSTGVTALTDSNLLVAGDYSEPIGDLTIWSNAGYTVKVTSLNGDAAAVNYGFLKGTGTNTDIVTYTIAYGGAASLAFTDAGSINSFLTSPVAAVEPTTTINITYTVVASLSVDTYSDTITFAITTP